MFGNKQDEDSSFDHITSDTGKPETIVGLTVKVDGHLKGDGDMVVEGEVKGSIKTKRLLTVGEKARIKANIEAVNARVAGEIAGNMKIREHLLLEATARINGDISAKSIEISRGAIINGQVQMSVDGEHDRTDNASGLDKTSKESTRKVSNRSTKTKDKVSK